MRLPSPPPWVERQRALLDHALSSLAQRPGKNLSLALVFAVVIFALASVLFLSTALRAEAAALLAGGPDVVVQRTVAGRHDLIPAAEVEKLARIRGVQAATGRRWGYAYDKPSRVNLTVMVPERFWGAPGEVVLGDGVARLRGLAAGESFALPTHTGDFLTLRVREVTPPEAALVAADVVLVSGEDFERLFGQGPDRVTDVALRVPNDRELETVAAKASRALPGGRAVTRHELARTYEAVFDWRSGLVVVVLLAAVLSFAIVAWDKAAGLSAGERHEIGVLKAIGWDTADVMAARAWEGAAIALVAFGLGVIGAYVHVFLAGASLFDPVLRGWSTLSPRLALTPAVGALDLATLFGLTVVPYLLATVVPAWRAAVTDPDAVMRS
jgi:ABC-type lipoprotein release transport system permease subunit